MIINGIINAEVSGTVNICPCSRIVRKYRIGRYQINRGNNRVFFLIIHFDTVIGRLSAGGVSRNADLGLIHIVQSSGIFYCRVGTVCIIYFSRCEIDFRSGDLGISMVEHIGQNDNETSARKLQSILGVALFVNGQSMRKNNRRGRIIRCSGVRFENPCRYLIAVSGAQVYSRNTDISPIAENGAG